MPTSSMRYAMIIAAGFLTGTAIAFSLIHYQGSKPRGMPAQAAVIPESRSQPSALLPESILSQPAVIDVTLHRLEEISGLLNQLAEMPRNPDMPPVALVLHGEEIRFFTRDHYDQYHELVELAGRLDASQAIEIKVCRTKMQMMGISEQDLPSYVEPVPFGPDEVLRLDNRGYEVYTAF